MDIVKSGQNIYSKYPTLRPILSLIKRIFFKKPKFSGWGMTTIHEPPWLDSEEGKVFLERNEDMKAHFPFNKKIQGITAEGIDNLLWRHWIVTYAVKHAIKFANTDEYNFVECGVEWGHTAYFALSEISENKNIAKKYSMHLYDAWKDMRKEELVDSEYWHVNIYKNLDINVTKKNLKKFNEHLIYHQGYIPSLLQEKPDPPNRVLYLHIDLNSSKPTLAALEFFYPHLVPGSVILLDDYGWDAYEDTKNTIESFFADKDGLLMKLPTAQAIYFHKAK